MPFGASGFVIGDDMWQLPDTFTVRKTVKYSGVTYNPGQTIPGNIVATMRNSDALLSMKYIVPTPDPHGRKTSDETPTPVSLPATVRRSLMEGGALRVAQTDGEPAGEQDEPVVEAEVAETKPKAKPAAKKAETKKESGQ
jgi:hypothetical protein